MHPQYLGTNYRDNIIAQLRSKYEGKCSRHGYILSGSIQLHRIADGAIQSATLNGDVRYDVQYYARICNPAVGSRMPARVINTNKFGVLAHCGVQGSDGDFVPVIEAIITRHASSIESEMDLDSISVGDLINIEVVGKKFELIDKKIAVIARAVVDLYRAPSVTLPDIGLLVIANEDIVVVDENEDNNNNNNNNEAAGSGDESDNSGTRSGSSSNSEGSGSSSGTDTDGTETDADSDTADGVSEVEDEDESDVSDLDGSGSEGTTTTTTTAKVNLKAKAKAKRGGLKGGASQALGEEELLMLMLMLIHAALLMSAID